MTGHHEFGMRQYSGGRRRPRRDSRTARAQRRPHGTRPRPLLVVHVRFRAGPDRVGSRNLAKRSASCATKICAATRSKRSTASSRTPELDPERLPPMRETYTQKLSFPDYYKPKFNADELNDIVEVTDATRHAIRVRRRRARRSRHYTGDALGARGESLWIALALIALQRVWTLRTRNATRPAC